MSFVYQGALGSLLYAAYSESKLLIVKQLNDSYFMYEYSKAENIDYVRTPNDCEFTITESNTIQTTGQCFFGNEIKAFFDEKTLTIGDETFKLFEFVGNYTLIDENFEGIATISMENGTYTWTQDGLSCSLTPTSGGINIDEGCELDWEKA